MIRAAMGIGGLDRPFVHASATQWKIGFLRAMFDPPSFAAGLVLLRVGFQADVHPDVIIGFRSLG